MEIKTTNAAHAYAEAMGRMAKMKPPPGLGESQAGGGFADVLAQVAKDTAAALREGEQASIKGLSNNANVVDIVTAVTNAEITLETVMALRDRVMSAYQQIIRMPI